MRTFRDPSALLRALTDDLLLTVGTVAVDGIDGSGKSTLARALAQRSGWTILHLDDYLHKDQGTYVQHIDAERLKGDLRALDGVVIVEGVCVLAVLERVAEPVVAHIYVKRLGSYGAWLDEEDSCVDCSVEEKLAELSAQVAHFAKHRGLVDSDAVGVSASATGLTEFREEVIRYHAAYRPFETATFVFERVESGT